MYINEKDFNRRSQYLNAISTVKYLVSMKSIKELQELLDGSPKSDIYKEALRRKKLI